MNPAYDGRHAELYDLFYRDKPYEKEAAWVDDCLKRFGDGRVQRILELACGTGNHAFLLEKRGYEITALDYSPTMLEQARQKARANQSRVSFGQADMREPFAGGKQYDAVLCLFNSIGYIVDNGELDRVLANVREALRPGGVFVFEFWHAAAMLKYSEPLRLKRLTLPEGDVMRLSETTIDHRASTARLDYTIYDLGKDGRYRAFRETQVNRYFLLSEMAGRVAAAGLAPVKWFSGYHADEAITDQTWHILGVARRP